MLPRLIAGGLIVLLSAGNARSHDYWLHPDRFVAEVNAPITVQLFVGDGFESEIERPFQRKLTLRFQLVSKKATLDLTKTAKDGKKPVARLSVSRPGTHWLVMERDVTHITLTPDKFKRYLTHEKLYSILKARKKAGEDKKPGRERYSRYLKCLLRVGNVQDDTWKRVVGLRLEIVPLTDPSTLKPGGTLKVRILFDGKPLADTVVFRHHKSGKQVNTVSVSTDKEGAAEIPIPDKGRYLVRLVHMRRCKNCPKSDWESFWGALSFGVR